MAKIKAIQAREILDSRGFPTVEATVVLDDDSVGIASVPSGSSVGSKEAPELRDQDPARLGGMGVTKAIAIIVDKIAPALLGHDTSYQNKIDQTILDVGMPAPKQTLGANSILAVSQAVLKASAQSYKLPIYSYLWAKYQLSDSARNLPTPCFNLINGGSHGAGNLDFQEFLIVPSSRYIFRKALEVGAELYGELRKVLVKRNAIHSVGDDGGFAPNLVTNMDALELLKETASATSYRLNSDIFLSLDVAANQIYKNSRYLIKDRAQEFTRQEIISYWEDLDNQYHILMLEDPLEEGDWQGWRDLTALVGSKTIVAGDDLLCTNLELVKKAIKQNACNGIIVKPNQIGTITETVEVVKTCKEAGWQVIVSQRGGETNDDFIADFAVGMGANYTKFGAPARGERVSKYNRMLAIATQLGQV